MYQYCLIKITRFLFARLFSLCADIRVGRSFGVVDKSTAGHVRPLQVRDIRGRAALPHADQGVVHHHHT